MRSGRALRRAAGLLAALALAACSLVVDTDGLSGGGGGAEAGVPTTEGGSTGDATGGDDGATGGDGATDSGPTDAGADADPCVGKTICEDFEGTTTKAPWVAHSQNGGTISLDSEMPHRGARSLHASLAAGVTSSRAYYDLSVGAKFDVDCELDLWGNGMDGADATEFFTISHSVGTPTAYESAYVFLKASSLTLGEMVPYPDGGVRYDEEQLPLPGAQGQWLHVRVHVTEKSAELSVTTAAGSSSSVTQALSPPDGRTSTTLIMGAQFNEGRPGTTIHIDDVRCVIK